MIYCIDYRNGALGNTVLAHILFASNQCQIDLCKFFSPAGDAHNIGFYNTTNLFSRHLIENPCDDIRCVLQITTVGWMEVLRKKLSYSKWIKCEPEINNWQKFYTNHCDVDLNEAWNDFYHNIKDQSWPPCHSLDQAKTLPKFMFEEIQLHWREPEFVINTELRLLEFLTFNYFDDFHRAATKLSHGERYDLDRYLSGDFAPLESVSKLLGWTWDNNRSEVFYQAMIDTNSRYLTWLDTMRIGYDNFSIGSYQPSDFKTWETAIILAKLCFDSACDPKNINWKKIARLPVNNSVKFNELIGT